MLEKILNKFGYIKKPSDVELADLRRNKQIQHSNLMMFMRERESYGEDMERLAFLEDSFNQLREKTIDLEKALALREKQILSYRRNALFANKELRILKGVDRG